MVNGKNLMLEQRKKSVGEQNPAGSKGTIGEWPSVLVIDDDAMNIEVMKTMLRAQQVLCDTSMNGMDALKLIEMRKLKLEED